MDYKLSVIMPALNEEDNINEAVENVVESFGRMGISGEIIIINDGSTDETEVVIKDLIKKYPFVRTISHDKPKGLGGSYWEGVKKARGEIVTMLPGDGENDSYEILRYISLMNNVDIVIPYIYNKYVRSWKRRMLSKIYKAIINLSFGMLLNYMNGTVMYRRSVLLDIDLKNTGFFYQTELLIKCIRKGYLYAEVPYAIKKRTGGKSKALTIKSFIRVVYGYISTVFAVYVFHSCRSSVASDSVTFLRWREPGNITIGNGKNTFC